VTDVPGDRSRFGRPHPGGPIDPGLQSERTGLAWARTALSLAANAALVIRTGIAESVGALTVAGVGLAFIAAVVGFLGWERHHQIVRAIVAGRPPLATRTVQVPAVGTFVAAVVVLVAVLY